MNTQSVQNALIELGFTFRKTDEEHPVWECLDENNIPMCSSPWLGECIRKIEYEVGGVN